MRSAGRLGRCRVRARGRDPRHPSAGSSPGAQLRPDGDERGDWFDTGDLAHIDADGSLRISGRTKDVIIRGGENIPVAYVENVLYEHPDIAPEPTFEKMRAYLAEKGVAKQHWPEKLVVLDDFPRIPSGKVQKFQLRERMAEAAVDNVDSADLKGPH